MFPCTGFGYGFWWIFPIIMLALCFFMMWRMGGCMMGRHGVQNQHSEEKTKNDGGSNG